MEKALILESHTIVIAREIFTLDGFTLLLVAGYEWRRVIFAEQTMFLPLYHGPTSFMVISRPYREKRSHAEVDTAQRHMDSGSEEEDY